MQEATHRYYNPEMAGDTLTWHDLRWGWAGHSMDSLDTPLTGYRFLLQADEAPTWVAPIQFPLLERAGDMVGGKKPTP